MYAFKIIPESSGTVVVRCFDTAAVLLRTPAAPFAEVLVVVVELHTFRTEKVRVSWACCRLVPVVDFDLVLPGTVHSGVGSCSGRRCSPQ